MSDNEPLNGTPSTTISAVLLAVIEPIPRTTIEASLPGWPVELTICTPATAPSRDFVTDEACELAIKPSLTLDTEPTRSSLRFLP